MRRFLPFVFAALIFASPVFAATGGLGFLNPKSAAPIQIDAEEGIEWRRNDNVYVAKKAKASSGDMTVTADELRAYYRGDKEQSDAGASELYRLEAVGNVSIVNGNQHALGEKAFYDIDQSVFVILGSNISLVSGAAQLTAHERIEYWQNKNMAVARGNAVATQDKNRLAADSMVAYFSPQAGGSLDVQRLDASGNVKVQSNAGLAQSASATYDLSTGLATMHGDVKLTQGPNQLNGDYAEMNTKTGISRMLSSKDGTGAKRVRALMIPDRAKQSRNF